MINAGFPPFLYLSGLIYARLPPRWEVEHDCMILDQVQYFWRIEPLDLFDATPSFANLSTYSYVVLAIWYANEISSYLKPFISP